MNLELLLSEISNVNKNYEKIFNISGENYNVFDILGLTSDELSHSKIISSFLNPMGSHGKGNLFLNLFLETIGFDISFSDRTIVETEKFIGYVSKNYDSGGRIDIAITDGKKQQIIIENKIYAGDQYNQLLRYYEYNPKAHLLYLTLYGNNASQNSTGEKQKFKYRSISYNNDIIKWLELCKKESIDNAILRETLTQYIVLIKQLTGQARSREMEKEYVEIMFRLQ